MTSTFSLSILRQRIEDGHPDLANPTSCIMSYDEASALVDAIEAMRDVVFKREDDGSVSVVSGLETVEEKMRRFT